LQALHLTSNGLRLIRNSIEAISFADMPSISLMKRKVTDNFGSIQRALEGRHANWKGLADLGRNFQSSKQTRHRMILDAGCSGHA
jgi:hypothetical protein